MKSFETLLSYPTTVSITDILSGETWNADRIAASVAGRHSELADLDVGRGDYVLIGYGGGMWGGLAGVRDADGHVSSHGEGEIVLQTPSLMSGYMHRDDLSGDAISDGWYATGDSGRVTNKGDIYITGRIKQEINRAGVKISPNEVEALLEKHEDVDEACAFPLPDLAAGEIVGVALTLAEGVDLDILSLREWCSAKIRHECVPDRWFAVDHILRTERGKIDRRAIQSNCLKDA